MAERATTATRAWRAGRLWDHVRSAPGTYLWLLALLGTTLALHRMSPEFAHKFLLHRSTNIHELSEHPVRVLVSSALWTDDGHWLPYAALYALFHARAEHWLGTARWLTVCAAAHVLATLASEGALLWAIHLGRAPHSAVDTLDTGVSYALAGVMGILTYRVPRPWRHAYATVLLTALTVPLLTHHTVTDLGHLLALLTGLACHPLIRTRPHTHTKKTRID
ncbi:rhomboid-like protein [Streptomyces griseoaurantiacus]|uniref:rhomboid-like protein n=1 Tax=Streptomyces griseoaurantiacus TaxID=68213 RepID=UPI001783A89E|nr:membrane protein [Streptomyces griseoaurantiacus]